MRTYSDAIVSAMSHPERVHLVLALICHVCGQRQRHVAAHTHKIHRFVPAYYGIHRGMLGFNVLFQPLRHLYL